MWWDSTHSDTSALLNLHTTTSFDHLPSMPILSVNLFSLWVYFHRCILKIVPGSNNTVAIELICTHIRRQLKNRYVHLRPRIARGLTAFQPGTKPSARGMKWLNITLLEKTPQLHVRFPFSFKIAAQRDDAIGNLYHFARQNNEQRRLYLLHRPFGDLFG